MEYSSAEMTRVLKVNIQCEACKVKVTQILQNIRGVYSITIDGELGTVKITGRVNPSTLLGVLEKYGRHAELKYLRFDGEVPERNLFYYRDYGYAPYGMEYSYPLLGCPQHQWYETSISFFSTSTTACTTPSTSSSSTILATPLLGPFWPPPPPPFSYVPKGLASGHDGKLAKEHKFCTIM